MTTNRMYIMPGPQGGQELEPIRLDDGGWDFFKWPLGSNLSAELRLPAFLAKPAQSEEPPPLAVVLDKDGRAWQNTGGYRGPWESTHSDEGCDWEYLNAEYGPLARLVPDPFAEPVEFPWKRQIGEFPTTARVEPIYNGVSVVLQSGGHQISPDLSVDDARELGRALVAAASEKEQP